MNCEGQQRGTRRPDFIQEVKRSSRGSRPENCEKLTLEGSITHLGSRTWVRSQQPQRNSDVIKTPPQWDVDELIHSLISEFNQFNHAVKATKYNERQSELFGETNPSLQQRRDSHWHLFPVTSGLEIFHHSDVWWTLSEPPVRLPSLSLTFEKLPFSFLWSSRVVKIKYDSHLNDFSSPLWAF